MRAGDRLELKQTPELALEMLDLCEAVAVDNLNCAESADSVARYPDLTVGAASNQAKEVVVRDRRRHHGWRSVGPGTLTRRTHAGFLADPVTKGTKELTARSTGGSWIGSKRAIIGEADSEF